MTYPNLFNFDNSLESSLSSDSRSSSTQNLEHILEGMDSYELTDSDDEDSLFEGENSSESEIIVIDDGSMEIDPMLTEISQDITDEIDEIHHMDYQHLYSEKQNNKYYIGLCAEILQNDYLHLPTESIYLMVNSISPSTYFKWSYNSCLRYLYYYGMTAMHKPQINILQLHIMDDGTYSVVIKTFWLKMIQRKWKKIFKMRKEILSNRLQLSSMHHREIHGSWPISLRVLPGLVGLLCY
tara:strand:- start:1932 stop:2648 length:717 start_codon:yes stop_codon:yes gene_type:complete